MIDNKLDSDVDTLVVGAGQAGLAAGMALRRAGLSFMIVDAADQPGGSWARYYDSLTLFSPSRFSSLPGLRLPGRRGRYPTRDEWPTTSATTRHISSCPYGPVRVCSTPAGTEKHSR